MDFIALRKYDEKGAPIREEVIIAAIWENIASVINEYGKNYLDSRYAKVLELSRDGNLLFLGRVDRVSVYNLKNLKNLKEDKPAFYINVNSDICCLHTVDKYLVIVTRNKVRVYDISDPYEPQYVSERYLGDPILYEPVIALSSSADKRLVVCYKDYKGNRYLHVYTIPMLFHIIRKKIACDRVLSKGKLIAVIENGRVKIFSDTLDKLYSLDTSASDVVILDSDKIFIGLNSGHIIEYSLANYKKLRKYKVFDSAVTKLYALDDIVIAGSNRGEIAILRPYIDVYEEDIRKYMHHKRLKGAITYIAVAKKTVSDGVIKRVIKLSLENKGRLSNAIGGYKLASKLASEFLDKPINSLKEASEQGVLDKLVRILEEEGIIVRLDKIPRESLDETIRKALDKGIIKASNNTYYIKLQVEDEGDVIYEEVDSKRLNKKIESTVEEIEKYIKNIINRNNPFRLENNAKSFEKAILEKLKEKLS